MVRNRFYRFIPSEVFPAWTIIDIASSKDICQTRYLISIVKFYSTRRASLCKGAAELNKSMLLKGYEA